jgi:hypothetical protein
MYKMPEDSQPAYEVGQTTRGPHARSGRVSGTVALVAIDGIHPESPVNCREQPGALTAHAEII